MSTQMIKFYYETKSVTSVVRKMKKRYPNDKKMNRMEVQRTVEKFEEHGTNLDRRLKNDTSGRPRTVRTTEMQLSNQFQIRLNNLQDKFWQV